MNHLEFFVGHITYVGTKVNHRSNIVSFHHGQDLVLELISWCQVFSGYTSTPMPMTKTITGSVKIATPGMPIEELILGMH
jgi:hypothetical protein